MPAVVRLHLIGFQFVKYSALLPSLAAGRPAQPDNTLTHRSLLVCIK